MNVVVRTVGMQAAYAAARVMPPTAARWATGLLLVGANVVPLLALLTGQWKAGDVLVAFWLENVAIGGWTVMRILTAVPPPPGSARPAGGVVALGAALPPAAARIFIAGFFTVHYGMFTLVHGVFTAGTARQAGVTGSFGGFLLVLVVLVASHGLSTGIHWFARGERLGADPGRVMFSVYPRVMVLHTTVLGAAFLMTGGTARLWGAPPDSGSETILPGLLLIGLKTAVDLGLHLRVHRARPVAVEGTAPTGAGLRG